MVRKREFVAIGGITALCGIVAWIAFEWNSSPPLIANLPAGTWEQISGAFSERVAAKFPLATLERILIAELLREGFRPRPTTTMFPLGAVSGYQKSYELDRSEFPCRIIWGVYWNADTDARLTKIVGQRDGICL
jgi:hypothetical protein